MKKEKQKPETKAEEVDKEETTEAAEAEEKEPETKADEKADEVEKLKKELSEKEDKFLRICAEYDNFRKRSQKEKSDVYTTSKADVIKELLPVLDNFERAAANSDSDFEAYKKGIDIIFKQFLGVLEKYGVEAYGERGEAFDPNMHSAVATTQDDELGENTIAQVFSKGYKLGDKIIREAVVQVANS